MNLIQTADKKLLLQFHGAVKTRIANRQGALWSRVIGAGFIAEDIFAVHPEENMRFFSMRTHQYEAVGGMRCTQLTDLNLRELEELDKWLSSALKDTQ